MNKNNQLISIQKNESNKYITDTIIGNGIIES